MLTITEVNTTDEIISRRVAGITGHTAYIMLKTRVMVTTALEDIKAPAGRIFLIHDDDVTVSMNEVR